MAVQSSLVRSLSLSLALGLAVSGWAQDPTPNTFVDVPVPRLTTWNDINTRTVIDGPTTTTRHSLRNEAEGVAVTWIYPDQATRDADVDGTGQGSVAYITWALDDGSGRPPGLQVVTDDLVFPVQNCIMASGERESEEFPGTILPKTCSDDPGSSKRFFLEVTAADAPIDLVFDTGMAIKRYKGIKDPVDDGGDAFLAFREEFGIGRIYRVIEKIINQTDERIVSFRLELGTGVGDDFQPLDFAQDGVAFELRDLVPRPFFEGSTGAGPREAWSPADFATYSPKLFDDGLRPRFDPGFFDHQSAGLIPPQDVPAGEKGQYIDTGLVFDPGSGKVGAVTPNYFNMAATQASDSDLIGIYFGYWVPESKAPWAIARHDDGNPESESDAIVAWWDGNIWRYGFDGNPDLAIAPFGEVPASELTQWASLLLGLELPEGPEERYESLESDDLSSINVDTYLYIGDGILEPGDPLDWTREPRHESITMRLVLTSVEGDTLPGTESNPPWLETEAPPLASYMPATGVPVALNDFAVTLQEEPVTIDVLANDFLDGALVNPAEATLTLISGPANGGAVIDSQQFTYTPNVGFFGEDTFVYTVTVNGEESNQATVKVTVNRLPVPGEPVANNDNIATFMNEPVSIPVLVNDTFEDGPIPEGAIITIVDEPLSGQAAVDGPNVIYTPNPGFFGFERFTYRVSVEGVDSNTALITVRVDQSEVIFQDRFEQADQ
jgi:hypothetical protein